MNDRIKVNITVGRFQPFTNGHLKCVEEAMKELGVPTVLCIINTPDDKADLRHPFPTSLLLPIYNELKDSYKNIIDIVTVTNADIVKIGETLNDKYEIVSWTCGTDRIDAYRNQTIKYKEKAGLSDDFKMIEVKRGDEDISATKVRKALLEGDIRMFNKLTPYNTLKSFLKGDNSVYDKLRAQLLKITQ